MIPKKHKICFQCTGFARGTENVTKIINACCILQNTSIFYKSNCEYNSDVLWEPSSKNDDDEGPIEGCNEEITARKNRCEIITNLI